MAWDSESSVSSGTGLTTGNCLSYVVNEMNSQPLELEVNGPGTVTTTGNSNVTVNNVSYY